jgi:hypothetical protein
LKKGKGLRAKKIKIKIKNKIVKAARRMAEGNFFGLGLGLH